MLNKRKASFWNKTKIDITEFLSYSNNFKAQIHVHVNYPQIQCIRDTQVRHDLYRFYMYMKFLYIWLDKKTNVNYNNQLKLFQKYTSLSYGSWLIFFFFFYFFFLFFFFFFFRQTYRNRIISCTISVSSYFTNLRNSIEMFKRFTHDSVTKMQTDEQTYKG